MIFPMRDEFEKILGDALRDTEAQAPDLFDAIAARRTPLHKFRNKLWLNRYRLMGAAALILAALTWFLVSDVNNPDQNGMVDTPAHQENVHGVAPGKRPEASNAFDQQRDVAMITDEVDESITNDRTDFSELDRANEQESNDDIYRGDDVTEETQVVAEIENSPSSSRNDISSDQAFDGQTDPTESVVTDPIVSDSNEGQEAEGQEDEDQIAVEENEGAQFEFWTYKKNNEDIESAEGAEDVESAQEIVSEVETPNTEEAVSSFETVDAKDDSENSGNEIELPTPPIKRFSMQLEAGPMFGDRTLNGDRSIIDQRNWSETAQWSTVAGFKFNYELNTNLEVFAGFTYAERKELMKHQQVDNVTEAVTKTVDVVVIDPVEGERIEQIEVSSMEEREVVTETKADNSYQRILVPVGLRYNFFIKRAWSVSPSVETAVQLWNRNSGLVLGANGETVALSSPEFSRTSVQARVGTALGYRFNGRSSLFIEPGYSTFINPVNSAKYPLKQRDFAIDCRIGWKVNF